MKNGVVTFANSKSRRTRSIPTYPDLESTLLDYFKAQGPFHGPFVAESILDTIVESLTLHGYQLADDPQIWSLHLQAQLRQINGGRGRSLNG